MKKSKVSSPKQLPKENSPAVSKVIPISHSALHDRDSFLNNNEIVLIEKMMLDVNFKDFDQFFIEDINNDSKVVSILKLFAYEWNTYSDLKQR